eukprot:4245223-Heterocapsa_arctica.AAC.1
MAPIEDDSNNSPLPGNGPPWTIVEHKRTKPMMSETRGAYETKGPGQAWVVRGVPPNPDFAAPTSSDAPLPIPPLPKWFAAGSSLGRC